VGSNQEDQGIISSKASKIIEPEQDSRDIELIYHIKHDHIDRILAQEELMREMKEILSS
jgi:hypothetical protein